MSVPSSLASLLLDPGYTGAHVQEDQMEGVFLDQERVGSTSPMVNKVLKEHAIENIAGTICLYIDDTTGWVPVGYSLGCQTIVTARGKYVPVNYQVAAEPIIAEILAYSWEWITFSNTFILGACRYNVICERDEGRVEYPYPATS